MSFNDCCSEAVTPLIEGEWAFCPTCGQPIGRKADFNPPLVVTRHQGLVDYLIEEGLIPSSAWVVDHATPNMVKGRDVWGVLPHSLSCLAKSFTEVPLKLTPEMRGKELSAQDVREVAGKPVTYKVERV